MAYSDRLPYTGTVTRETVTQDSYGGIGYSATTTVLRNLKFNTFNVSPFDREMLFSEYGTQVFTVALKLVTERFRSDLADIKNNDIIEVSSTEKYRILGIAPQRGRHGQLDHLAMLVVDAAGTTEGL